MMDYSTAFPRSIIGYDQEVDYFLTRVIVILKIKLDSYS